MLILLFDQILPLGLPNFVLRRLLTFANSRSMGKIEIELIQQRRHNAAHFQNDLPNIRVDYSTVRHLTNVEL